MRSPLRRFVWLVLSGWLIAVHAVNGQGSLSNLATEPSTLRILPVYNPAFFFDEFREKLGPVEIMLFPGIEFGSHTSRTGFSLRSTLPLVLEQYFSLAPFSLVSFRRKTMDLGGERSGQEFVGGLGIRVGFGRPVEGAGPWLHYQPGRSFEFGYERLSYQNDRGSSQLGGRFEIVGTGRRHSFGFSFHNDLFAFVRQDVFRTAAAELSLGFEGLNARMSVFAGMKLWTGIGLGNRTSFTERPVLEVVDGRLLSSGIFYLGIRKGALVFELGWDSEAIRDFFQNGTHQLIHDPLVPLVDRPGIPYLSIRLYPDGDLY